MKAVKILGPVVIKKIDCKFTFFPTKVRQKASQAIAKDRKLITFSFFQVSFVVIALYGMFITTSHARNLFELTVDNQTPIAFSNIKGLYDTFNSSLANSTNITLDVRGQKAIASNLGNVTRFQVDALGIDKTFPSNQGLYDFLKSNGNDILNQLLKGSVSNTPVDPVAGNPNSIMAKMSQDDFRLGSGMNAGGDHNLLGSGLMVGYSEASGFRTAFASIPINYIYTLSNPSKPPYLLILDVPLRYVNVEGASIFEGSIGLGATVPIHNTWSLTPMFRYGVVGSYDYGTLQAVYSGTVTSKYDLYFDDLKLSFNNMIGYYQTGNVTNKFGGNYGLQNVIFRNGLSLEGSLNYKLFDEPTSWELQFTDVRVTGDKWFIDGYEEITATFGTRRRQARMDWQTLRVGAGLTLGKSFQGGQIMFTYRF